MITITITIHEEDNGIVANVSMLPEFSTKNETILYKHLFKKIESSHKECVELNTIPE